MADVQQNWTVMDIETVVDPLMVWTPPADKPDRMPPIPFHRVVLMTWATFYRSKDKVQFGQLEYRMADPFGNREYAQHDPYDNDGEQGIIAQYQALRGSCTFVTWNGRGFDFPVMDMRAMRYGRGFSQQENRYRPDRHKDLCDLFSSHGSCTKFSLDSTCQMLGLPGKAGTTGADVETMLKEGQRREVLAYGMGDTVQTSLIWLTSLGLYSDMLTKVYNQTIDAYDKLLNELKLAPSTIPRLAYNLERDDHFRPDIGYVPFEDQTHDDNDE